MSTFNSLTRLLLGTLLLAGPALADESGDVSGTLDAFHRAASEADQATYFHLMTPDIVFLGTDGTERWQGQDFRDFVTTNFSRGRGWTYLPRERRVTIAADGETAWFDEMLDNATLGICRGSGVLVHGEDGWQVAQYNLSVPIPNGLVDSVAEAIRREETVLPASTTLAPASPETGSADTAAPSADDAGGSEPQEKRCPIRHKTVRAANC